MIQKHRGTLMGWSEYRTSDCVWLEDMGLVVEPPRPPEEHFYCDHGHWFVSFIDCFTVSDINE